MILLEFQNRIISECLKSRVDSLANGDDKVKEVDVTVADFDGILYHVSNPSPSETSKVRVSISMPFFHELEMHNVGAVFLFCCICFFKKSEIPIQYILCIYLKYAVIYSIKCEFQI